MLARPFGGQVAKTHEVHPARQSAFNCRPDEIERQEAERDCHVDLADAAPFSLGNIFSRCRRNSDELVKPMPSLSDRRDQYRTGLRPVRTNGLGTCAFRKKNLMPPLRWYLVPWNPKRAIGVRAPAIGLLRRCELDDQLAWLNLDARNVGIDESPVVSRARQFEMLPNQLCDQRLDLGYRHAAYRSSAQPPTKLDAPATATLVIYARQKGEKNQAVGRF